MAEKITVDCEVCGNSRQHGGGRQKLRRNPTYQIMVCDICHRSNWDGWTPHLEHRVTRILREKGLPIPARNAKGWLPRE